MPANNQALTSKNCGKPGKTWLNSIEPNASSDHQKISADSAGSGRSGPGLFNLSVRDLSCSN